MLIRFFPVIAFVFFFSSCTGLKRLGNALNKHSGDPASITATQIQPVSNFNTEIKFLDDISGSAPSSIVLVSSDQGSSKSASASNSMGIEPLRNLPEPVGNAEKLAPTPLQFKYSLLLGAKANEIQNIKLFEFIEDWYGAPYRLGGTTKKGIDCSALVQSLLSDIYGIHLPRTSREQYKVTQRISTTELLEGDLLFFHTRGRGVSHVGLYLQNNKFVHASISGGVMISDMYEPYFVKRLVGAGRVEK